MNLFLLTKYYGVVTLHGVRLSLFMIMSVSCVISYYNSKSVCFIAVVIYYFESVELALPVTKKNPSLQL